VRSDRRNHATPLSSPTSHPWLMAGYARDHQPCVVFMDEIDAIGGKRSNEGSSADREVQRTLMELLSQLDGFDSSGQVKVVMATNRPDVLDPALLRPGRLDRKIEIPLPNDAGRLDILKIHAGPIRKQGEFGASHLLGHAWGGDRWGASPLSTARCPCRLGGCGQAYGWVQRRRHAERVHGSG